MRRVMSTPGHSRGGGSRRPAAQCFALRCALPLRRIEDDAQISRVQLAHYGEDFQWKTD